MTEKAEESPHIQKARQKLEERYKEEQKLINNAAIAKMKESIQIRISRHQEERVPLQDKSIELFDENRHPQKAESHFVKELLHDLKEEAKETPAFRRLIGRIKK